MMTIGLNFVVICMDSINDDIEKKVLTNYFEKTDKEIIDITYESNGIFRRKYDTIARKR